MVLPHDDRALTVGVDVRAVLRRAREVGVPAALRSERAGRYGAVVDVGVLGAAVGPRHEQGAGRARELRAADARAFAVGQTQRLRQDGRTVRREQAQLVGRARLALGRGLAAAYRERPGGREARDTEVRARPAQGIEVRPDDAQGGTEPAQQVAALPAHRDPPTAARARVQHARDAPRAELDARGSLAAPHAATGDAAGRIPRDEQITLRGQRERNFASRRRSLGIERLRLAARWPELADRHQAHAPLFAPRERASALLRQGQRRSRARARLSRGIRARGLRQAGRNLRDRELPSEHAALGAERAQRDARAGEGRRVPRDRSTAGARERERGLELAAGARLVDRHLLSDGLAAHVEEAEVQPEVAVAQVVPHRGETALSTLQIEQVLIATADLVLVQHEVGAQLGRRLRIDRAEGFGEVAEHLGLGRGRARGLRRVRARLRACAGLHCAASLRSAAGLRSAASLRSAAALWVLQPSAWARLGRRRRWWLLPRRWRPPLSGCEGVRRDREKREERGDAGESVS